MFWPDDFCYKRVQTPGMSHLGQGHGPIVSSGVLSQTITDCIRYIIGVFCYTTITDKHSCFIVTH